ncbi:Protein of unknown function [Actinobaculum suis]|uniref:DUF3710 domain-containing protein n=2 Tax=Actinobaculum suis TaxID=1657 RepID=A0A1G7BMP6_9ACTO|nr:Protein of unknown function [Actinobaculum suis]
MVQQRGLRKDDMRLFWRRKRKTDEAAETAESPVVADSPEVAGPGPYDEADAPENPDRVNAGSLLLPPVPGAKLQFSVDRNKQTVLGVVYQFEDSGVQLQAFAAPKSAGIWDSVRADVAQSIVAQGGRFTEVEGEYGKELRAMMPGPNEKTRVPVRFLGIDGPRWLLRIGLTGKAALNNEVAAEVSHKVLDDLVVVRGSRPLPVRELIPLQLPTSPAEADAEAATEAAGGQGAGNPPQNLPVRGPEISEVR